LFPPTLDPASWVPVPTVSICSDLLMRTGLSPSANSASASAGLPGGATLTLLRHGQSEWNRDRRFAGWSDIDLSDVGVVEAERAGARLRRAACRFDCCFTSVLRRATRTSQIVLHTMGLESIPVERSWRLNERHYGALQGMGLWTAMRRHGPVRVLRCRQFDRRPPQVDTDDPRFPGNDPHYAALSADQLPRGESLADVQARLLPYWEDRIAGQLRAGRHVLVVSHNNTLRLLIWHLENRGRRRDESGGAWMTRRSVPTGVPVVYSFDAALEVRECRVLHDDDASGAAQPTAT